MWKNDQKSRVPCVLFPQELGSTNTAFVKIQQQILDRRSCERMEFRLYRMQWEQNPPNKFWSMLVPFVFISADCSKIDVPGKSLRNEFPSPIDSTRSTYSIRELW